MSDKNKKKLSRVPGFVTADDKPIGTTSKANMAKVTEMQDGPVSRVIENDDGTRSIEVNMGELKWETLVDGLTNSITGIQTLAKTIKALTGFKGEDDEVVRGYAVVYRDLISRYKANLNTIETSLKDGTELTIETYIDIETDINGINMETSGVTQDVLEDLVSSDAEISNSDVVSKLMASLDNDNKELIEVASKGGQDGK